MRKGCIVGAVAALLAFAVPAHAQFGVPFGGPGMLTSPEAASGAIGAGAAQSVEQQQQCLNSAIGRDRPRGLCPTYPPASQPRR